jgi:hypothetical protein
MTWKSKVQGVVLTAAVVAALGIASGADWIEFLYRFFW